jgi:hypothetical protein
MPRLFWLFGVVAIGACLHGVPDDLPETKPPKVEPEPIVPPEQPVALADRLPGPLSYDVPSARSNDQLGAILAAAQMRDSRRRMTSTQIVDDLGIVREVVTRYYGETLAHISATTVMEFSSELSRSKSLHVCVRPAGAEMPCVDDQSRRNARPAPTADPPFELADVASGIVQLTVRDLTGQWSGLGASELARLARAHGVVVDLRTARGTDPTPLIPWLEQVTGRAPLRPVREISRPEGSDSVIADYTARYVTPVRDRAVWDRLLGEMPPARKPATSTITVLVGGACDAACELVTRVLETYSGATVFGGVRQSGRIGHDDPARVVLPHSQLAINFFATKFVLAADIEKATGPTDQWAKRHTDADDPQLASFAVRDIEQRDHGGWPRCDALPYVRTPALLPDALKTKFPTAAAWGTQCDGGWGITVIANAPLAAMQRLIDSCSLDHMQVAYSREGLFWLYFPGARPFGVIAQIAASPLVDRVELLCQPRIHLL